MSTKKRRRPALFRYEKRALKKGHRIIAGVDEAGRGPLAGPVVASAVIINDFTFKSVIDDSKKLSPAMRLAACREIIRNATIGISMVDEEIIDSINIRRATLLAMEEAVINLGVEPNIVLIDGNMRLELPYEQELIIGGDAKSITIAAASIIAKVTRDSLMAEYHNIYPQYGFDHHKGYGTKKHIKAIEEHGLSPIHRKTFKIRKKLGFRET